MGNQLSTNTDKFEFLPFTDVTMEDLPGWFGDIYADSIERVEGYEGEIPLIAEHIPTKFMVISYAYAYFDSLCYEYAINGHDEYLLSDIKDQQEAGETEEEITQSWLEWRDYNGGYGGPPNSSLESAFVRDICRGLDLYHFSYIEDGFEGNIYRNPEHVIIKEWKNCPIVQVW